MIPLEVAQWGALGTQHVLKTYEHVREQYHTDLQLLGFVVNRFKRMRKYQTMYLKQLREHFGDDAFDTVIPDLSTYEQAVTDRIPVNLHLPCRRISKLLAFCRSIAASSPVIRIVTIVAGDCRHHQRRRVTQ